MWSRIFGIKEQRIMAQHVPEKASSKRLVKPTSERIARKWSSRYLI
jgi:hypothetical protein